MDKFDETFVRITCFNHFPKLVTDSNFKVTSPEDASYNCIAWAYHLKNVWMWPNETGKPNYLDGIRYWPDGNYMSANINNFVEAFKLKGYSICHNGNFEEGYRKIALYGKPNSEDCTHAARQINNGYWSSKLGLFNDIQHGTAETIENDEYGVVKIYMKREHK